jgi:ParB family chromosome partitioning protein
MPQKPDIRTKLTSADELFFTTQEERDDMDREKVVNLPISEIDEFPDHPFQIRIDDAMRELVESIKEHGVLTPAIARVKDDGRYELVSGHRRKVASELAGLKTLPTIIRDMDRDASVIFMVDANMQREVVLPSEKAFAFKLKLEAMRRQGQRTDLTSPPMADKLKPRLSVEVVAEQAGESRDQVWRYIRLTELLPEMLSMVDDGKMAFRPAVEISYLSLDHQQALFNQMELELATPSLAQAIKLKKFAQEGRLSEDVIASILSEEKPNQVEQFKMPKERLSKYFPAGTSPQKMEDAIIKGLELLDKRERNRDAR